MRATASKAAVRYNHSPSEANEELSMVKHTVRFSVDLTINEGRFDAFAGIAQEMILRTQREPGALGYDWCLSSDRRRCRILETTPTRMLCWRTSQARWSRSCAETSRDIEPQPLRSLWEPRPEGRTDARGRWGPRSSNSGKGSAADPRVA